jgi:RNA polymerase sigma-70 factor (ECF subfamily)
MDTGWQKDRIKNDPQIAPLRRSRMLMTADMTRGTGQARKQRQVRPVQRNGKAVGEGQDISDQTVWMLAVRDTRDRAAFARLFDFYAPRLKGFVMRGGMDAALAEEIVQDVMLTVWHKAAQFDPERAQVSGWIYQITRNRQIDTIRRTGRAMPEELKHEDEHEPDAGQVLAMEQEASKLKLALGRLKPDQRAMIEKAYLGDLTHQEIREQTGLPLGTIKSRIRLGLDRLRHELKELREP